MMISEMIETNAYLHNGGALATIDGSDDALYLLGDALGSVRGVTDEAGDLDGTADYAVYGEVRASSGVSTLFRFTGEQHDSETGFTYLRARYANPALGRFVSADTVQPNAR
jgi:RHS repeat-associated protein